MLTHQFVRSDLRLAAPVPVTEDLPFGTGMAFGDEGVTLCGEVTGRTTGTCALTVWGSTDGALWFPMYAAQSIVFIASGIGIVPLVGVFPRHVKVHVAPVGGFDGSLRVWLQTGHITALPAL